MLRCSKKGSSLSFESASFDSDGRAHYFSLTLTTEESRERCAEIGKYLATKYGTPSYGIKGGGGGYNFPKKQATHPIRADEGRRRLRALDSSWR